MTVSLEVVPRSREALIAGAAAAAEFKRINSINVPDLLRFPLRSWDACGVLSETGAAVCIPHVRAIDFDPDSPFPYTGLFRSFGIGRVLVIAGDPPRNTRLEGLPPGYNPSSSETVSFIKKLKTEMPELTIYGAFDPYRSNIRYELDYLKAKEDAGADGFMSQPFFDLRLLEIYAEYLEGKDVFWGVSPVLSGSNRSYWESRNRAIFPKAFRPDLSWNVEFGRRVLRFCEVHNFNLYLMPVKVDIRAYLSGLFEGG